MNRSTQSHDGSMRARLKVSTITVPKEFANGKLTWTLVANGETSAIPLTLNQKWAVQLFKVPRSATPHQSCVSRQQVRRIGAAPRHRGISHHGAIQPDVVDLVGHRR